MSLYKVKILSANVPVNGEDGESFEAFSVVSATERKCAWLASGSSMSRRGSRKPRG